MKIEIKKRGTREFYEEVLYVAHNYMRILKNPHHKVEHVTNYLLRYILMAVFGTVFMGASYFYFKNIIFVLFAGMFLVFLYFYGRQYFLVKKQLEIMGAEGDNEIDIDEEGVRFTSGTRSFCIGWGRMHSIIINKESVCFLSGERTDVVIAISTEYLDSVLEAVRQCGRENLITDNR